MAGVSRCLEEDVAGDSGVGEEVCREEDAIVAVEHYQLGDAAIDVISWQLARNLKRAQKENGKCREAEEKQSYKLQHR